MSELNPATLKESETVEFKEQFNDSALKSLAAFVNAKGGSVFVGVKDDATIVPIGITDKQQQNVVNITMDVLGIQPEVTLHTFKGNDFLQVKVKPQRPPVSVRGKYYQRIGNTTREATGDELKQLFLDGESWDAITVGRFSMDDIDLEVLKGFVRAARKENRLNAEYDEDQPEIVLERLGLIIDGQITNGAILLFGKTPQKYFPNAVIRIGRFRDETTVVSDAFISGNLFRQVEKAEEQIKSLIERRYDISEQSFARKDVWQYPLPSIREALLNALVHRSYFDMGVKIQIKVFDESLWIYNPGNLPGSLTVEDLKKPHSSHPRNPLIAHTFFRAGLIEEWGSGIQRMINALHEEGLPEPEFEEQGDGFVVILFAGSSPITEDYDLNERQEKIMVLADSMRGGFKISDISDEFKGITDRTLRRDLNELVELTLLGAKGEKRGRTYFLLK